MLLTCYPTLMLSVCLYQIGAEGVRDQRYTHTQVGEQAEENLHKKADGGGTKALLGTRMQCIEQSEFCPWTGVCGLFSQQISLAPAPTTLSCSGLHMASFSQQGHSVITGTKCTRFKTHENKENIKLCKVVQPLNNILFGSTWFKLDAVSIFSRESSTEILSECRPNG